MSIAFGGRLWTVTWATNSGIRASPRHLHSGAELLKASTSVKISELWLYPVKSCRGQQVQSARLGRRGLVGDREFVIAAPSRRQGELAGDQDPTVMRMITQRSHPMLACLEPAVCHEGAQASITLSMASGWGVDSSPHQSHTFPIVTEYDSAAQLSRVNIWGDFVQCVDQGPDAAAFLSHLLALPGARLLRLASASRYTDETLTPPKCETSLADGFPLLLTTQSSLRELEQLHGAPLTMERFRPNVVVDGCHPFEEDSWHTLSTEVAGCETRVHLHSIAPCSRCSIPDVDQASGSASKGKVASTLKRFRNGHACLERLSRFGGRNQRSIDIFSSKPKATFFGLYQFAALTADTSGVDPAGVERAHACLQVGQEFVVDAA